MNRNSFSRYPFRILAGFLAVILLTLSFPLFPSALYEARAQEAPAVTPAAPPKTEEGAAADPAAALLGDLHASVARIRGDLIRRGLPQEILSRLDAFATVQEKKIREAAVALGPVATREKIERALGADPNPGEPILNPYPFRTWKSGREVPRRPFSSFRLPDVPAAPSFLEKLRGVFLKREADKPGGHLAPPLRVSVSGGESASLGSEFTSETDDIQFTQAIKNKAAELNHDPLKILNFVRANIRYTPYYGSKKGADAALNQREGNDLDIASLLSALLRVGDGQGNYQIPTRYRSATVKLDLNTVTGLLGVSSVDVAADVLGSSLIPTILWVDDVTGAPLFFTLDHVWVEAYIDYDWSRGLLGGSGKKRWVPLEPSLISTSVNHNLDIVEEMTANGSFNILNFYETYLTGFYGTSTPIEALTGLVGAYLAANHPDLSVDDVLVQTYRSDGTLEFIPPTLPFEVVQDLGTFAAVPAILEQTVRFTVTSGAEPQTLLDYTTPLPVIADRELTLPAVAATAADQAVIDSFGTIYKVVPLSLVNLKPVIQVQGQTVAGGAESDPALPAGTDHTLTLSLTVPLKDVGTGVTTPYEVDVVSQQFAIGNAVGIAINSGRVVVPDVKPGEDTTSSSFVPTQKLYRTALNYLFRDQASQDTLAEFLGGTMTHFFTRAFVFNGIEVTYEGGIPYSFTWKGLRIDASVLVDYYHFIGASDEQEKEFIHLFGLQASLDEARIFEDDYVAEAISTVKGLVLINQGQIPGVSVVKIDQSNEGLIDTLDISQGLKDSYHQFVQAGDTLYTPTAQFTYLTWTGLVYIHVDHATGFGGYIIGEGLNGGYLLGQLLREFAEWLQDGLRSITASIDIPFTRYTLGDIITYVVHYFLNENGQPVANYDEQMSIDTANRGVGTTTVRSGYGTNASAEATVEPGPHIGTINNGSDHLIIKHADAYEIPRGILKAIIHKETYNKPFEKWTYRYEPRIDYDYFSGPGTTLLGQYPAKQFALSGYKSDGTLVSGGEQMSSLNPGYLTMVKNKENGGWSLRSLIMNDTNRDKTVTFAELYQNDRPPGSQNWPDLPDKDFTAQVIVSGSYGLGHVLYKEVLASTTMMSIFDPKLGIPARSPYEIATDEDVGIHLAAAWLRGKFDDVGPAQDDNCAGWSKAVKAYNGAEQYKIDVCKIYNDNYQ